MSERGKTRELAANVSSGPPVKFFFDVSGLVDFLQRNAHYSGIQRTLTEIVSGFSTIAPSHQVYLTYCDDKSGALKCLPFDALMANTFTNPIKTRRFFHPHRTSIEPVAPLRKYGRNRVRYLFHRTRLDVLGWLGKDDKFGKYGITVADWRSIRTRQKTAGVSTAGFERLQDIAIPDDHFIVLDFSNHPRHVQVYGEAKRLGLKISVFVHDLIPLVRPQLCFDHAPTLFFDWLEGAAKISDQFLVNSEATFNDLSTFVDRHEVSVPVGIVPLAQTRLSIPGQADPLRQPSKLADTYPDAYDCAGLADEVRTILAGPFVLCVGTIEARKNNWRILMAWKSLLDRGCCNLPKIVFAGKPGIMRDDFEQAMQATGHIYGYAQVVETPDDVLLDLLYRRCMFTVMASLYEGWGLPVGEALAYGKTAVVSSVSSLPEVGGEMVEYCDPDDISSIADAIAKMLNSDYRASLERKIGDYNLRNWSDVAADLLKALGTNSSEVQKLH